MLSTRRVISLSAALVLSGATVVFTQHWAQGQMRHAQVTARAQTAAPATRVLVAAQALPAGTILKPGQLRWQDWPTGVASVGYYASPAIAPEQLTGAVVRTELAPGEPLNAARLVQPGDRGFLAAMLKPGFRAVTINVSANTGVAGFVVPGDHVDLILTRALDGGASRRFVSETLLSNVRVLGMDQRATKEKKDATLPQTATLEVTPHQAELVALASDLGRLSLSLRSLADPTGAPEGGEPGTKTWDPDPAPHPSSPGAPARHARTLARRSAMFVASVTIVRGSQVSDPGAASR